MLNWIKQILGLEQSRFIIVGVLNTIIGMTAMFLAYNLFHMGYWLSSAMDYIVASIFSYFANKYFTFQSKKRSAMEVVRFIINVAACYLVAYGIARPVVMTFLKEMDWSVSVMEQISMLFGLGIFIVLNYFGQRYFVFVKKNGLPQ